MMTEMTNGEGGGRGEGVKGMEEWKLDRQPTKHSWPSQSHIKTKTL